MKRYQSMIFRLLLVGVFFPSLLYAFDDSQLVRVGLATTSEKIVIEGNAIQVVSDEQVYTSVAINRTARVTIEYISNKGQYFWKVLGIRSNGLEMLYTSKNLALRGSYMRQGARPLPKNIILSTSAKNRKSSQIQIIGVMNLHDYLVGVVASEVPLSWSMETLKAQAVAARSYALVTKKEREGKPYHLSASIADQVFRPVIEGNEGDPKIQKAVLAVKETDGVILKDKKNQVIKAYYHAECGGSTANAREVWNSGVEFGTAKDEGCAAQPRNTWSRRFSRSDLTKAFGLPHSTIEKIGIIEDSKDGRVKDVVFHYLDGEKRRVSGVSFRNILGTEIIKSTRFKITEAQNEVMVSGVGFGHGVGLCQWGSHRYGKLGWSSDLILNHYYPKAQISRLGLETKKSARYE